MRKLKQVFTIATVLGYSVLASGAEYPQDCGASEDMRVDGNVGIGTANPGFELEVDGEIRAHYGVSLGIPGSQANWISTDDSNGNLEIGSDGSVGSKVRVVIDDNGGKVGIGTTTPSEKLDVAGGIKADSLLFPNRTFKETQIGYDYWLLLDGHYKVDGHIHATGNIDADGNLNVDGNLTVDYDLSADTVVADAVVM